MTTLIWLSLTALAAVTLLALAVRDAFRQTAGLGWTKHDEHQLRRVLASGIESLG